ncbi:hypothetical protein CIPAW_12G087700 [Carya illinoinensis]|uniref:AAA+ ATPase domain-containing protein n=1 Tax=Carya illinoinensis TaxID=32201 RepID=A0A8T1NXL1_CARIL|nr:hypothetical protein CIPAW_12G087700 [Carya illinoinensis]
MEQKSILLSALSVGVGVGVGLGFASGQAVSKWSRAGSASNAVTLEKMEQEMLRLIVDGRESKVTEQTRVLLTSAAYFHLKDADISKYTQNLSPASRAILLSGPTELYQQMLAKALAHFFEAKLLLLDVTEFSLKIQSKYGSANKEYSFKRSTSESTLERLSDLFGSFSILPQREDLWQDAKGTLWRQSSGVDIRSRPSEASSPPSKLRRNASASANISNLVSQSTPANPAPFKRTSSWSFDEKLLIQSLYRVLVFVSKTMPIVLYLRDVDKFLLRSQKIYNFFQKMLKKLSGLVLILGSRIMDPDNDYGDVDERLTALFPYNIEIRPPEDESHLVSWRSQLEDDMKMIQVQDNRNHIVEVLSSNDLDCDDLDTIRVEDTMVLSNYIEEIVVSAISYHLMNNKDPEYRNGKLVISSNRNSLSRGLSIFQEGKSGDKDSLKLEAHAETSENIVGEEAVGVKPETNAESITREHKSEAETSASVPKADGDNSVSSSKAPEPGNEFEKRIRPEVIPANEIDITFANIGALDEIKEPDLFKGGLLKPCKGILLFGPPGTGKTMLAKAIAQEAGASFINVSMSTITSKWFGEDEKNVRALFTLAAKVSPTIIFVDEVDSMLGQQTRVGEHEAMWKIKNEFMTHWDGLLTKQGEGILVLAATNRPFDLDEAIIRRFERRIMVGLPSVENREIIFTTLLVKEKVEEGPDFKELARMTEGYTRSDLKILCTTAAYRPVRELIQQESLKVLEKKQSAAEGKEVHSAEGQIPGSTSETKEGQEGVITLRPLNMEDLRQAKSQVAASFAAEGSVTKGGSRKKQQLTYFL